MPNRQYQAQLLPTEPLILDLPDAEISYSEKLIRSDQAWDLFESLKSNIDWRQESITIYGKEYLVPRLWCWMADHGLDYSYSNKTMKPVAWCSDVLWIKSIVEAETNHQFNSVLINYYRDGQDSTGWHADDEPELGKDPVIASISLGATRDFQLRHNRDKNQKISIALQHGSLLLMQGTTQSCWQHQIPKRVQAEPRINLTFRTIKAPSN